MTGVSLLGSACAVSNHAAASHLETPIGFFKVGFLIFYCTYVNLHVFTGGIEVPSYSTLIFPEVFRVLAYQSSGLPHDPHTRPQIVPYTAAMGVLS